MGLKAVTFFKRLCHPAIKYVASFQPLFFIADNKDAFRKYKGVELLIELMKKYKSLNVIKALNHVLKGNCNAPKITE